jgi:hypothetical protein
VFDLTLLREEVKRLNGEGMAPGAITQAVLRWCQGMESMTFGNRKSCWATLIDEETGQISQMEMGPDSDYVVVTGPNYTVAHRQVYPGSGTTVLTIKKRDRDE